MSPNTPRGRRLPVAVGTALSGVCGGLLGVSLTILDGDDDAPELGEHVEYRGLRLLPVPRVQLPCCVDIAGVVSGSGVPADRERVDGRSERDGALYCGT